jgi:hypothetical protein
LFDEAAPRRLRDSFAALAKQPVETTVHVDARRVAYAE